MPALPRILRMDVHLLTVTFTKDMTGLSKFWWDFGDGSPVDSLNASPVHIFTNSNPASIEYRSVKLKVRSPGGCYDDIHFNCDCLSCC